APSAAGAAAPSAPWSWWHVEPSKDVDVADVALLPAEIVMIDNTGGVHPRPAKAVAADGTWHWDLAPGQGAVRCLLGDDEKHLICNDAIGRIEVLTIDKIVDEKRRAELDALVAKGRPSPDACARAERCCVDAFKALGATCNPDDEIGKNRLPDRCAQLLRVLPEALRASKKPVPQSCR
ncbi:MAG TPA: hypothetical protein VHB21_01320, partial [Minicystis sp.]|nr:hypothetical protein [Minicystis sp.]